jgi:hypothetical protein
MSTIAIAIAPFQALQLLEDGRDNLVRRLEAVWGKDNWNKAPVEKALDVLDDAKHTVGLSTRYIPSNGWRLDTLINTKDGAKRVRKALKEAMGVHLFVGPESLEHTFLEKHFGLGNAFYKWAAQHEPVQEALTPTFQKAGVIIQDTEGFHGAGFRALDDRVQDYFVQFHEHGTSFRAIHLDMKKEVVSKLYLGLGAAAGALASGIALGYLLDKSGTYNFQTQLAMRTIVAFSETAGAAIEPIAKWTKLDKLLNGGEPVIRNKGTDAELMGKVGLFSPLAPAGVQEMDYLMETDWKSNEWYNGFMNVETNNINNQLGVLAVGWKNCKETGLKAGLSKTLKDPLIVSNILLTLGYIGAAISYRILGGGPQSGVSSGGEAGTISSDTALATGFALLYQLGAHSTRYHLMTRSPQLREKIFSSTAK